MKEEPYCKFMLKHDIKNYLRQFRKTFSMCFQLNALYTELVMRNYFRLEQYGILSYKYTRFIG